ncbi:MAG: hypothetical protein ACYSVY_20400 [Planctomycetota bacterium]|jgi:hypothetical protein
MSAKPKSIPDHDAKAAEASSAINAAFLRYLPAIETHAAIQFRGFSDTDREEAMAEARAAAFVNFWSAVSSGKGHRLKPSMVAHYAALHVHGGRHVGGRPDNASDILSRRAQRIRGFKVERLPWDSAHAYDILKTPDQRVWRHRLLHDRRTPVPDQVGFRIDFSQFMAGQHDRTRTAMALLAAGHKQTEVADHLGVTPAAICLRRKKAAREWAVFQGESTGNGSRKAEQAAAGKHQGGRTVCPH